MVLKTVITIFFSYIKGVILKLKTVAKNVTGNYAEEYRKYTSDCCSCLFIKVFHYI